MKNKGVKNMGATETSNYRRRRKDNLIKVCGNQCNICGYHKTNSALEFHHINAEEKLYGISSNGTCHDLEKDLAEIKKCILVCANCHREIHDKLFSEEELYKYKVYNEDIANQLRENKGQLQNKKMYFCSNCGKEITRYSKSGLCEDCYKKQSRIVERPDRDTLKHLIRTVPFTKIGEQYGVSDKAITKWCKTENLPSRKKDINNFTDEQWELV